MQGLHRGSHGSGALLECEPVAGTQRAVDEPAHGRVEFAGQHGMGRVVGGADEHIATADVNVVCQFDRNRQWGYGRGAVVVEGVDGGDRRPGARGQVDDRVADVQCPRRQSAGVTAALVGGRS